MAALKVWDGTAWVIASQQGAPGPPASPPGGATDSILVKASAADYDTRWAPYLNSITIGSPAASTGHVRLAYGYHVMARDQANATDVSLIILGGGGTSTVYVGYTAGAGVCIGYPGAPLGFGVVPVARSSGWAVTAGYTALKTMDPNTTTLAALARVVGTLVDVLKAHGIILP